jgi:acylphosphatase
MTVARRVLFFGDVQGVGFRYTTQQLAADLPVAGFVRNLQDGSVELVAEGTVEAVDELQGRLAKKMSEFISRVEVTELVAEGLRGFQIRR